MKNENNLFFVFIYRKRTTESNIAWFIDFVTKFAHERKPCIELGFRKQNNIFREILSSYLFGLFFDEFLCRMKNYEEM